MRALFVSNTYLRKELGASKVLIELAEEMERLGWHCQLLSLAELVSGLPRKGVSYPEALRKYLRDHAHEFDVVDYDHAHLPFPRRDFPDNVLFVARSVLLARHTEELRIPRTRSWRSVLRSLLLGGRDERRHREVVRQAYVTLAQADLVNLANDADKATIVSNGIPGDKVVVVPYGLSRERFALFDALSPATRGQPTIAFVGTFDDRKGAADFPRIVRGIVDSVPGARFKLLGTLKSAEAVVACFPVSLRSKVDVVPAYRAETLPDLLASCSVGVFPSYVEGFGFGVLEMLAAGVPVFAYNVPGPPMMLPPEYLVPAGDTTTMCNKVAAILNDRPVLEAARSWAKGRSREFSWSAIAEETSTLYQHVWQQLPNRRRTASIIRAPP